MPRYNKISLLEFFSTHFNLFQNDYLISPLEVKNNITCDNLYENEDGGDLNLSNKSDKLTGNMRPQVLGKCYNGYRNFLS